MKRLLGLLVCMPLLFAACDDSPADRMIGASLTEDGDPALYFVLCRDDSGIDSIDRVTLIDVEGTDPYDGDDEIVWRMDRVGGNLEPLATEERSMVVAITTGQIPNGYSVKERLDAPVSSYGYVVAVGLLRPSRISIAMGWEPGELQHGRVLEGHSGDLVSVGEFQRRAAGANCRELGPLLPYPAMLAFILVVALTGIGLIKFLGRRRIRRAESEEGPDTHL